MGVIHMQMYTYSSSRANCPRSNQVSIEQENSNLDATMAQRRNKPHPFSTEAHLKSEIRLEAIMAYEKNEAEQKLVVRRHWRYPSHPPPTPSKNECRSRCHRRVLSHASEGRPPRHPGSQITVCDEVNWNNRAVFGCDLDDYQNERFPFEMLSRINSTMKRINATCGLAQLGRDNHFMLKSNIAQEEGPPAKNMTLLNTIQRIFNFSCFGEVNPRSKVRG